MVIPPDDPRSYRARNEYDADPTFNANLHSTSKPPTIYVAFNRIASARATARYNHSSDHARTAHDSD